MTNSHLTIKDFEPEAIKKMCCSKFREINAEISDLTKTKKDFIAMSLACQPAEDWQYDLALEVINGLLEVQNTAKRRFQRYFDIVSGKHNNEVDLGALKRDIKCQDLLNQPKNQTRGRLWYCSPWRNEANASLVVYLDSNTWWDYGESCGGSVLDLYMKINDCDFKTALKDLSC